MTKTFQLTTNVPDNREIKIALPGEIPVGPAQLTVSVHTAPDTTLPKLGDILQSGFFGLWRDRSEIANSLDFARQLRNDSWQRGS